MEKLLTKESSSDPFSLEESLTLELQVKSLAYAQGVNEGAKRAVDEGRSAGLVRGWQAGADLGAARSMSSFVLALPWSLEASFSAPVVSGEGETSTGSNAIDDSISSTKREPPFSRALRIAEQLQASSNALRPLKNKLDEDLVSDIQRVRAKTLVLGALAQLPAALEEHYQATTASSSSSSSSSLSSTSSSIGASIVTSALSF